MTWPASAGVSPALHRCTPMRVGNDRRPFTACASVVTRRYRWTHGPCPKSRDVGKRELPGVIAVPENRAC